VIPHEVLQTILGAKLPCFVYDGAAVKQRVTLAASLLDRYFFPIKACPEPDIVRAALDAGCGLDLCSDGDIEIASAVGCPGQYWKFTSAHADDALLRRLCEAGALLDADSLDQALHWGTCGGTVCGLRITAKRPKALYGSKFGLPAQDIAAAALRLAFAGVHLEGLHLHDQHANLTPVEFAARLVENLAEVDGDFLRACRYVNIGGSWPMRHGNPASPEDLRNALGMLREFQGGMFAELPDKLRMLKGSLEAVPVTESDVPPELKRRFVGASGKLLLQIAPKVEIFERGPLEAFVRQVKSVVPNANGEPVMVYESMTIMRDAYRGAFVYAFVAIVVILLIAFRSVLYAAIGLVPLVVGLLFMVAGMWFCGINFNSANIIVMTFIETSTLAVKVTPISLKFSLYSADCSELRRKTTSGR